MDIDGLRVTEAGVRGVAVLVVVGVLAQRMHLPLPLPFPNFWIVYLLPLDGLAVAHRDLLGPLVEGPLPKPPRHLSGWLPHYLLSGRRGCPSVVQAFRRGPLGDRR